MHFLDEFSRGENTGANQQTTASLRSRSESYDPLLSGQGPTIELAEESGNLFEYWQILRRSLGTWILFAFAGLVLGLLVTLPQTPVYQAHTSVELLSLNEDFMNMKQTSPVTNEDRSYETSDLQTQIKILQSESVIERVVAKLKNVKNATADPLTRESAWRKILGLKQPDPLSARAAALNRAAASVKVRASGHTRILEITVDSPNPQVAAEFANTLTNEYIEQNLEARWRTTQKTSDWLSRQLDEMRIRLERSEDALQRYARDSGLLFTDEKSNISSDKLRQVQQALSTATADRIAKQSRYEMAQSSPPDALPDILNDTDLRDTQSKITELHRQIAELGATYTPEYTKVKRVEAQLSTLQAAFDHDRAAILHRIKNDYEEASRRERLLASAYGSQTKVVTGEGEKSIQYNILKREADSNRQLYETMLQQLKQSTIASAMRASNIRVLDQAQAPKSPYKPNHSQSAGLGLLTGVFLGAAFIVMRSRTNRTFQQPGDGSLFLNLPELGIIPSSSISSRRSVMDGLNPLAKLELVTWQRKPSMIAESFRATLTSILLTRAPSKSSNILVLTSPSPAEGKSTVTSNLAIAFAEMGQKVLLIDADMRRPRLHEIFNLDNHYGLSSLLKEKTTLNGDRFLGGLIRETEIPGLFILTSGPVTSAATNLLYSSHMPNFLKYVRERFEIVLIDTPPMLQISDARILSRMADRVIMVVRAGQTMRDAAVAAMKRLAEDGTQISGVILNDWNPKIAGNGYYKYYGQYGIYPVTPENIKHPSSKA